MLPKVNLSRGERGDYLLFGGGDLISTSIMNFGVWEDRILQVAKLFYSSTESPVVLDVGANLGAFSIPVAKDLVELSGVVYSFEPQRIVYYQLCGNVFLNRLDNVYVRQAAVGEVDGVVLLPELDYSASRNIGAYSLDDVALEHYGHDIKLSSRVCETTSVKLDSFSIDGRVRLLKIDVEGYELNVLRGGCAFLEDHDFPPILFEAWGHDWFRDKKKELMLFLSRIGYRVDYLGGDDYVAQHAQNDVWVDFSIENSNILASRRR